MSVRALDGTGHAHTLGRPRRFLARRGNGRIEYAAHGCMNAMVSADTVAVVSAVVSAGFPRAPQRESEAESEQPQTHQYREHHTRADGARHGARHGAPMTRRRTVRATIPPTCARLGAARAARGGRRTGARARRPGRWQDGVGERRNERHSLGAELSISVISLARVHLVPEERLHPLGHVTRVLVGT